MSGYKTYLIGIAMLAYAAAGFALGKVDGNAAIEVAMQALAIMGLRHGITTENAATAAK